MGEVDVLLRRAHEAGYRFPQDFPGFSATLGTDGGDRGRVVVRGRAEIEVTVDGTPSELVDWARGEIASIVGHRWAASYDAGDGRWSKRAEGDMVRFLDDPFDSAYRLRNGAISEVHRTAGGSRFVVSVNERRPVADGRFLPVRFTVFHWSTDADRLVRADHYTDAYVHVEGVHLPARRQVVSATDDGLTTRVLDLTDHQLGCDA